MREGLWRMNSGHKKMAESSADGDVLESAERAQLVLLRDLEPSVEQYSWRISGRVDRIWFVEDVSFTFFTIFRTVLNIAKLTFSLHSRIVHFIRLWCFFFFYLFVVNKFRRSKYYVILEKKYTRIGRFHSFSYLISIGWRFIKPGPYEESRKT